MKVVQIQFTPWDKIYNFNPVDSVLLVGDYVIVKTEIGTEIGRVIGFTEVIATVMAKAKPEKQDDTTQEKISESIMQDDREIKPILRKATTTDLEKVLDQKQKKKALDYCKKMVNKYKLPMKLVDVNYSFDGSRVTFAFIADGRVDFRELVKDLTRHFNRTIRLQQIGIRDEARLCGDYGHCGRPLCCGRFLSELSSITSEMAELQQVAHRGSERISGICGRLMCCLAYEENGYEELARKLPAIGSEVSVKGKKGTVVAHHILKKSIDVKFPGENGESSTVVEVDLKKDRN